MADDDEGWVTVRRGRGHDWRHAPAGTPLWEKLPPEIKGHVVNFLNQELLWELCLHHRSNDRDEEEEFEAYWFFKRLMGKIRLAKVFCDGLRTLQLLSTPHQLYHFYEAFMDGLTRFAFEITDVEQRKVQGAAHVSHAWDTMLARKNYGKFLEHIVHKGYRHPYQSVWPEDYLHQLKGPNVRFYVRSGVLRPVHGAERARIDKFLADTILCDKSRSARAKDEAKLCAWLNGALRLDHVSEEDYCARRPGDYDDEPDRLA